VLDSVLLSPYAAPQVTADAAGGGGKAKKGEG